MCERQAAGSKATTLGERRGSAQQRRTREAILDAAKRLIAEGETPSVDEVASAADVSRRTIYMHFSNLERLLIDATAGLLGERTVEPVLSSDVDASALDRVDALARALLETAPETLPLGRRMLRLTVETPPVAPKGVRRGYRRIDWIERAVGNLRSQLNDEQFQRLVSSLAVVLGWESMIVLRDICGLAPKEEERVLRWAAASLVAAMTAEVEERSRGVRVSRKVRRRPQQPDGADRF